MLSIWRQTPAERFAASRGRCSVLEAGSGVTLTGFACVRADVPRGRRRSKQSRLNVTEEDLRAEIDRLRAENERLKSHGGRGISIKVSETGGVSVYGLGRFPVTLYKEQWTKLLAKADDIRAFIDDHDAELKGKPES